MSSAIERLAAQQAEQTALGMAERQDEDQGQVDQANALQTRAVETAEAVVPASVVGVSVGVDMGGLQVISALAKALGDATTLPKHIRSQGDAVALMVAGAELGFGPMKALRSLHMVEGKIELSADAMLGLVKRSGYLVRWLETTDRVARLQLVDTRDPDHPHEQVYDMRMAADAGLATKTNWRKYPDAMLRARCVSSAVRAYCPDVLGGSYLIGEISQSEERPLMHAKDDIETQAGIELANVQRQRAAATGDAERIAKAEDNYHQAKQDRRDAQMSAMEDTTQIAELELVEGWENVLESDILSQEDLLGWLHEEGGRYRALMYHRERARVAIKKCVLAINTIQERKRGVNWITAQSIKDAIDASPAVLPDDEGAETDVDLGQGRE